MFREITLHSTLSCNTILCSKVQHGSRKTFALPLNIFLRHWNFWSSSKKSLILLMHYSIVIYIYIFIYIFLKTKQNETNNLHLQWISVTSPWLSEKIGTGEAPTGGEVDSPPIECRGSRKRQNILPVKFSSFR